MSEDVDEPTGNKHLEAYLLWLFGYVMFCGSQGARCRGPDPPLAEDRRHHYGEDAPNQLGRCSFGRNVQGPVRRAHQDGHPVNPPRMSTSAAPVELRAASHRPAINRPIGVPSAGRGARPSRQANHGVDVVPPPGSYFEPTSLVSYQKVMQFVKLTYSLVCSSLGWSRLGGHTWTSSGRSTTSWTLRLFGSCSPTPWSPRVHRRVSRPCAFWDREFWMMKTSLVHDMYVEEYHVERVTRQFGLYQA
jgi:hypothetical protein